MKIRKFRHKYLRSFIKEKKITDAKIKSALYGAMFDLPVKVKVGLSLAKNDNHKQYLIKTFSKIATIGKSNNVLNYLKAAV